MDVWMVMAMVMAVMDVGVLTCNNLSLHTQPPSIPPHVCFIVLRVPHVTVGTTFMLES